MKNTTLQSIFLLAVIFFISCTKQEALVPLPEPEIKLSYISFKQDTIAVTLSVTTARKENVGTLFTTTIEGKLPDSTVRKNNLIIRVTGDSVKTYKGNEIFASYTDSLGITYANNVSDTSNKVTVTKLQKIKQGIAEGNFTIKVSNSTKTKILLLAEGKFSTSFSE
ncbi:hypothetical protein [Ferruginibacter sp. SUN106]|uniref:hypothetical protein n=1 Tax=Ferruginibacter sp. SUN106 TaxID=2978348 RepID=UPI003D3690BA